MSSTDTAEEVVDLMKLSPAKKRSKKRHFSLEMKEVILNVYKKESEENTAMTIDEVVLKVASKVGVCRASVFNVIREYKRNGNFSKPKTIDNRKSIIKLLDDFDKHAIRRKVHEFFFRNEIPSIHKVLQEVNEDAMLPNFKRSTFYKVLKHLNFKWKKRGRNSLLVDREEIVLWRREYLTKIKSYREQNRKIFYLDETWVNAGHTTPKVWVDETVTSSRKAFLEGLSPGLKNPTGKGKRLIVCHIGNENGFVDDGLWCFESKKTGDYHEEMNGESFEKWFSNILSRLEENAVIVLDNAPYHSRRIEKIPTTATKKGDIRNWLRLKNIGFEESMLKVQLLAIVKQHKAKYQKYVIDEMAASQNKIVLRLPPYHCELNPIELIWAEAKNFIAQHNTTFKFADLKELFNEALRRITAEKWKKCIEHVKDKVEEKMWKLDNIMEDQIEPLIINTADDDDTDDDSNSSSSLE